MIAQADAVHIPLADKSVHCVMTSPPYWGLRKYAGEQGEEPLGLEPTPERHIERMVEICREVRRVLRGDGVFWLNYGDCYASSVNGRAAADIENDDRTFRDKPFNTARFAKAGSLMMMPHRVALALQQDGWIVRQDCVWQKRNPMPESISGTRWVKHRIKEKRSKHATDHNIKGGTQKMLEDASVHQGIDEDWVPKYVDCPGCEKCIPNDGLILKRGSWRHTRSHEFIFMLTKKMQYFSNQEAVREAHAPMPWGKRRSPAKVDDSRNDQSAFDSEYDPQDKRFYNPGGRNPRSVLDIPTAPYKGAHYATFPPNLIAPLIRATCPRWACPVCGQGWAAVVEQSYKATRPGNESKYIDKDGRDEIRGDNSGHLRYRTEMNSNILGYRPTCSHPHTQEEAVPGTVFDPFVGSGTTVKAAQDLLRRGIGIDISMEYLDQQAKVRAGLGTPSNALEDLPLFENLLE